VNTCATHTGSLRSADRRSFVHAVGVLTGVIVLGNPLAALLPSRAWAVELRALSSAEATPLLAMIRTIAPGGFNDLKLLPAVPLADSGAMPIA
jgi:hypothetical protein